MRWTKRDGAGLLATVVAALALQSEGRADPATWPVVIYSVGPQHLRVRVASGPGVPCSASVNQQLFDGTMEPGQALLLATPGMPVCVEHTYGAFPDTEWSPAEWWPVACRGRGPCRFPPVIRVVVSSDPKRGP